MWNVVPVLLIGRDVKKAKTRDYSLNMLTAICVSVNNHVVVSKICERCLRVKAQASWY